MFRYAIDAVQSSGPRLAQLIELPPYHYGVVFEPTNLAKTRNIVITRLGLRS
jgi:hypothetical protein